MTKLLPKPARLTDEDIHFINRKEQKLIKRIELQIEYLKFLRQFPEEQRSDLISSFFAVIDYLLPKQNDEN